MDRIIEVLLNRGQLGAALNEVDVDPGVGGHVRSIPGVAGNLKQLFSSQSTHLEKDGELFLGRSTILEHGSVVEEPADADWASQRSRDEILAAVVGRELDPLVATGGHDTLAVVLHPLDGRVPAQRGHVLGQDVGPPLDGGRRLREEVCSLEKRRVRPLSQIPETPIS